jgi:hypothetical protein
MSMRLRISGWPLSKIVAFAATYMLCRLSSWWLQWLAGGIPLPPGLRASDYFIALTALAQGVERVVGYHPFYRLEYRAWLERTPWTSRKTLPLGSVGWCWEDGLIIGGLIALAWADGRIDPVLIATLPLMSHTLVLLPTLFVTGAKAAGYVTIFALGLAVRLVMTPWEFLAAAASASVLAHLGLRRSLTQFPWPGNWFDTWRQSLASGAGPSSSACGWPHDQLRADLVNDRRVEPRHAALASALAGWWVFAIAGLIVPQDRNMLLLIILVFEAPVLAMLRLSIYRPGYAPPMNLWGRIVTLRWIIPRYHKIYFGPLCTLVTPWAFLSVSARWGIPLEFAVPPAVALTLFVALSCKPSLRSWRLTGRHRIVPTAKQGTQFVKVG